MPDKRKRPIRWWDGLAALLGLLLLQISAGRLVSTRWTDDLALVHVTALLGIILGFALGYSVYSGIISSIFSLAYGCCVIPWQIGVLFGPHVPWLERLVSLRGRLWYILQGLAERRPITDNLLFLFLMAILFWLLSVYTGYALVRHGHIWRVVLPGGFVAFVIHTFDPLAPGRGWYLAFYLFFALISVARLVYLKQRARWRQLHTNTPPDIGFDLMRGAALIALVVVLFSWNMPVLAETLGPVAKVWQTASHPWISLRDRLSFAFASLRASVGFVSDFYGDSLPLGLGTPLSEQVMMEIEAPDMPPMGVRYYWRAWVYSEYANDEWSAGFDDEREYLPEGRDLAQTGVDVRPEASFVFFPHTAISTIYVAPQPLWVSRPSDAVIVTNPDGTIDLSAFQAQEIIRPGEQYEVRSSLGAVTVKDLRAAGEAYPEWVLERYLQLPDDITPRMYALAQQLAQGQDNAYDIATAITEYLRATITYQPTIDAPPADVNRIDWFLFDYQIGYCYYYATSEVLLLRSLGIPARMAVGFAQGEPQSAAIEVPGVGPDGIQEPDVMIEETITYVVREKDAHAWPEVYFPGIGWIEFEPTVNQNPLFRPSGEELLLPDDELDPGRSPEGANGLSPDGANDQLAEEELAPEDSQTGANLPAQVAPPMTTLILRWGGLALAITLLGFVIWKSRGGPWVVSWLDKFILQAPVRVELALQRLGIRSPAFLHNWADLASMSPLSQAYQEINRSLKRLGIKTRLNDTPFERAGALMSALPASVEPTGQLIHEYQLGIFSPYEANLEAAQKASRRVRKLTLLELARRVLRRVQEPEGK